MCVCVCMFEWTLCELDSELDSELDTYWKFDLPDEAMTPHVRRSVGGQSVGHNMSICIYNTFCLVNLSLYLFLSISLFLSNISNVFP